MKYVILSFLVGLFCVHSHAHGMSVYASLARQLHTIGGGIESIANFPVLGKLTNFLPCGMVVTCLKEYPGQTMIVLGGLLMYALSRSETIRSLLSKYNIIAVSAPQVTVVNLDHDETLFIFDGDDSDDAEEQMDTEDELLDDEYDSYKDSKRSVPQQQKSLFL